jgi:F0F1-type ATP synthase alpha subunit
MYAVLYSANEGAFDIVPLEKIEAAREALLRELKNKHAKLVDTLNTGDKPSDKDNEALLKVANAIAKQYEVKEAKK